MQGQQLTTYFVTIGVMIVLVVGVGIAIFVLRARLFGEDEEASASSAGVLEAMRAMRDRGEISEDEYRAAQAAIVAKAMAQKKPGDGEPAGPRTNLSERDALRARPGYDLTGAPLPRPRANGGRRNEQNDPG